MDTHIKAIVVFCDDIRIETTGKHLLVGVYGGNINVNKSPFQLPLAIWAKITGLSLGTHSATFIARKRVGVETTDFAKMVAEVNVENLITPICITLPGLPLSIDMDCTVEIVMSFDDQPEFIAGEIGVITHQTESAEKRKQ